MPARTLAYRLLVVSPILFVGAIAARARLHIDPHVFTSCTAKQHASILAYRDVYLKSAPFRDLLTPQVNRSELRKVAEQWIEGTENGTLRPLTPAHLEDFCRDGIKQEITRVRDSVSQHLMRLAKADVARGNYDDASIDLVYAIRVAEAMKYSDPYAVSHSGMQQRAALVAVERLEAKLNASRKLWVRNELKKVRDGQQTLESMARLLARLYQDQTGVKSNRLVELDDLLRRADTADSRSVSYLASLPKPGESTFAGQPTLLGLLRMSGTSQHVLFRVLDQAIAGLDVPVALVSQNPQRTHVASVGSVAP